VNIRYIIGGFIVVVFIIWGATAFMKTTIQYVSIAEAKSATHNVQVIGKIDFDKVNYNEDDSRLEFAIYDDEAEEPATAERMNVVYYGVVPGNFDQATSVVLIGKPTENSFVADKMLVKCPSKYQGEGEDGYQDMKKHDEATNSGV